MKYMGWSWDQFMACPEPYVAAIVEYAEQEKADAEAAAEEAKRRADR